MNDEWLQHWKSNSENEQENGNELVVFKLPKDGQHIEAIEKFIQERLSK